MGCEAVIFFNPEQAANFAFQRKRGGHTLSKGRFLGAQMAAYLDGGLWLTLAAPRQSRGRSTRRTVFRPFPAFASPGRVRPMRSSRSRRARLVAALRAEGAGFYEWSSRAVAPALAPREDEAFLRLVCSFETSDAEIDRFARHRQRPLRFGAAPPADEATETILYNYNFRPSLPQLLGKHRRSGPHGRRSCVR